jgi:hypothetical protein
MKTEKINDTQERMYIVSYQKTLTPIGDLLSGPTIINNEDYPDLSITLDHLNNP